MKATIILDNETYSDFPNLVQYDKGFVVTFNIKDDDNSTYSLMDKNLNFKTKLLGGSTTNVSSACTITNYTSGIATYTFQENDLMTSGVYYSELEVNGTGFIQTIKLGKLFVQEEL